MQSSKPPNVRVRSRKRLRIVIGRISTEGRAGAKSNRSKMARFRKLFRSGRVYGPLNGRLRQAAEVGRRAAAKGRQFRLGTDRGRRQITSRSRPGRTRERRNRRCSGAANRKLAGCYRKPPCGPRERSATARAVRCRNGDTAESPSRAPAARTHRGTSCRCIRREASHNPREKARNRAPDATRRDNGGRFVFRPLDHILLASADRGQAGNFAGGNGGNGRQDARGRPNVKPRKRCRRAGFRFNGA